MMEQMNIPAYLPRLWKYRPDDITTWAWLECLVSRSDLRPPIIQWVKNPEFKYAHLMKNY